MATTNKPGLSKNEMVFLYLGRFFTTDFVYF